MEGLIKGDVVVVPFPFSDLSQMKKRPAIICATLKGNDLILCQITSKTIFDEYAISLEPTDFQKGVFNASSNIRPNKIFTADKNIILYRIGTLYSAKIKEVSNKIISIFK